jgi:hypothetical protein
MIDDDRDIPRRSPPPPTPDTSDKPGPGARSPLPKPPPSRRPAQNDKNNLPDDIYPLW